MEEKIEVELRAKITLEVLEKLNLSDAKHSSEHDVYYSYGPDPDRTWIVRTRVKNGKSLLTFKSKKKFGEGAWSEVESPIENEQVDQYKDFFLSNGFFIDVEIKKERASFKSDDMSINVDKIEKLGDYIEAELMVTGNDVEKAKEELSNYFKDLGIKPEDITSEGYVSLMRNLENVGADS